MIVNVQFNLFKTREGEWAVRIDSIAGSVKTKPYRTPREALNAASTYCEIHTYFDAKKEN